MIKFVNCKFGKFVKVKYGVISYGRSVMSFLLMIQIHEEKSYRVSLHVASNFFEPTSHTTCEDPYRRYFTDRL